MEFILNGVENLVSYSSSDNGHMAASETPSLNTSLPSIPLETWDIITKYCQKNDYFRFFIACKYLLNTLYPIYIIRESYPLFLVNNKYSLDSFWDSSLKYLDKKFKLAPRLPYQFFIENLIYENNFDRIIYAILEIPQIYQIYEEEITLNSVKILHLTYKKQNIGFITSFLENIFDKEDKTYMDPRIYTIFPNLYRLEVNTNARNLSFSTYKSDLRELFIYYNGFSPKMFINVSGPLMDLSLKAKYSSETTFDITASNLDHEFAHL
jgi:hypothetical protein